MGNHSRYWISCLDPLVYLLPKTFRLLGFQIFWLRAYLTIFNPETRHVNLSFNRIVGVMASVLPLSVVDRWFEPQAGQIKNYKSGIYCL
jgi:hypothetical protein